MLVSESSFFEIWIVGHSLTLPAKVVNCISAVIKTSQGKPIHFLEQIVVYNIQPTYYNDSLITLIQEEATQVL